MFLVAIPLKNGGPVWRRAVDALVAERAHLGFGVLVIDSGSIDGSDDYAKAHGFEVLTIASDAYDHGATRNLAVREADRRGFVWIVFLTHDCVVKPGSIANLLTELAKSDKIAIAYGRQLPRDTAKPVEQHARHFNYGPQALHKTLAMSSNLGFKTVFSSNSFAAYRLADLLAFGGFPEPVICSEDVFIAAKCIQAGKTVAYVAEAECEHSHAYTALQEAKRMFEVGVFHATHPWILKTFGKVSGEGLRFVRSELAFVWRLSPHLVLHVIGRSGLKYLGYRLGLIYRFLPKSWCARLSVYQGYWR